MDRSTWATMVGAATTWFDQWLAFLQPQVVKVSDLVAANPDDPPLPSPADLIAAISPPYLGIPSVLNYMLAKLQYYEFTQVAVCNTGVPSGWCTQRTGTWANAAAGPQASTCAGGPWSYYSEYPDANYVFPSGQHHAKWTMAGTAPQGLCVAWHTNVNAESNIHFNAGDPLVWEADFSTSATFFQLAFRGDVYHASDMAGRSVTILYKNAASEAACGAPGPPPTPVNPSQPVTIVIPPTLTCGTTADLCTAVRQLDQRLTQIYSLLTIVQRHSVPFAYVPGAVHSGLTGTGSFAISGLLGLRIQLSSTHGDEPILPGNPPYLWDQGWLSVNDANGLLEEKRLTRTGMEWFPRFMETATSFNWTVAAGVVMVVTELEAET